MDNWEQRVDLTCALRWCARLDLHEGVANHFSVAVAPADASAGQFLINPGGRHFSQICPDELVLSGADAADARVDDTARCLHGYFHRHLPAARCLLHTHMPYATALASLADWRLLPIDQNACRFFNRVAYDETFGGMLLAEEEAARQCALLMDGRCRVLVMRGHGVLVIGDSVAEAFDRLYYFERACRNQWLALASGRELYRIPDETAEHTARQWEAYPTKHAHFTELRRLLREEAPALFQLGEPPLAGAQ